MGFCSKLCFWCSSERKEKKKKALCRTFSLKELHAATNNFNYDNKLGEGMFGSVYWGQLWDGSQIAVKRLKVWNDKAEAEFAKEIEILGKVHHKNLLTMRGYCVEGQEHLIVYEYMSNLSLSYHLHGPYSTDCLFNWKRRMDIAIGSAEGIVYLHNHATPRIIHRDIKASNVLLGSDFQAQVVDFGFAKFIPESTSNATAGEKRAIGYCAPEYAMYGKVSESCDVYSFGILLLEIVSGRRPITKGAPADTPSIVDWALPLVREDKFEEIADAKLEGKFDRSELRRVVLAALVCSQSEAEKRPTMLELVGLLKGTSKEKLESLENHELFKGEAVEASKDVEKETTRTGIEADRRDIEQEEIKLEVRADHASPTRVEEQAPC